MGWGGPGVALAGGTFIASPPWGDRRLALVPQDEGTEPRAVAPAYFRLVIDWDHPEQTTVRLRGDWLPTHDLGSVDADGYLSFPGRLDEIANVGGVKVARDDIERVARAMRGVLDGAAVGASDPGGIYGGVAPLYVVADRDAGLSVEAAKDYCAQHLQPESVPCAVRFVAALPRTDTGKLQRRWLRGGLA